MAAIAVGQVQQCDEQRPVAQVVKADVDLGCLVEGQGR
jgi:hypothetical protein